MTDDNDEREFESRTYFPNGDAEAYFLPTAQTIYLNKIDRETLARQLKDRDYIAARFPLQTVFHEATHWADVVGTVWGRSFLGQVYEAYGVAEKIDAGGQEQFFWKLAELHDEQRRLMLPDYYRLARPDARSHSAAVPWGISFSSGQEFDPLGRIDTTRPILFVRFSDNSNENDILIRQPLTVGALLEVNAVWSEYKVGQEMLALVQGDQQVVEAGFFRREMLSYLYDPDLTLYTAPAHMVGHFSMISDAAVAYEFASTAAHAALNLTGELFPLLNPDQKMKDVWGARLDSFVQRRDRGYAFAVLVRNAPKWEAGMPVSEWIAGALKNSGLPALDALYAAALTELKAPTEAPDTILADAYKYLTEISPEVLAWRTKTIDPGLSLIGLATRSFPFPPAFDANNKEMLLNGSTFDVSRFDQALMDKAERYLRRTTNNFLSGCR